MDLPKLRASKHLADVRYEIRGPLARRALELEQDGFEVVKLNIGNPGAFDFRMPEAMRRAMVQNLGQSEAYCHQQGIFPAREAVVMRLQDQGIDDVTAEDVFVGNGVSELIMLTMRALLDPGDEVLVPSPDYPLWTASVVNYPCRESRDFVPDPDEIASLITDRTKAIVVINPNNPTGAVYPRAVLERIAAIAEDRCLTLFSDEIYDQMCYDDAEHVPMASLVKHTLCGTFNGLSKVYRACGLRVGWLSFNGEREHAKEYLEALDLLASLRLCSNVPGQWAVQTALGGHQSVQELVAPGGRLHESRRVVIEEVGRDRYLHLVAPKGSMYAFLGIDRDALPNFDDQDFAMELLERKHVLIAPGSSFNVPYDDHFRITLLPSTEVLHDVFARIRDVLDEYATQHRRATAR